MNNLIFKNRTEAGQMLAERLRPYANNKPIVIALARGGVPVGFAVAQKLGAPLDVLIVRKIGAPGNPEFAIGALAEDGELFVNREEVDILGVAEETVHALIMRESSEISRRIKKYRQGRPLIDVQGRTVIVVDDGFATGASAVAALKVLESRGAAKIVVAVPVCSADSELLLRTVQPDFDLVCLEKPAPFWSVGVWYDDFDPISDEEIVYLLANAHPVGEHHTSEKIVINVPGAVLRGTLYVPDAPRAAIIFAHGTGRGQLVEKSRFLASYLYKADFAVLLINLLQEDEADNRHKMFDLDLLKERVVGVAAWLEEQKWAKLLPVGLCGASTGAAAVFAAASELKERVYAIVSCGGRPDQAKLRLSGVEAPTLLIVGGHDEPTLALSQEAQADLPNSQLNVIPQAGPLFDTPGAMELVAQQTKDWFADHLQELKTHVAA